MAYLEFQTAYVSTWKWNAVRCLYNPVSFLKNTHNRNSIARPWGRNIGCFLWVWTLIKVLSRSRQWCMHYRVAIFSCYAYVRKLCANWIFKRLNCKLRKRWFNTLRPRQDGRYFADDIFMRILFNENCLNFHWNMFARVQLTIIQHWFR